MFTMGQRLGLGKRCGSRGREARQRGPIITIQRPIRTTTLQSILSLFFNVVGPPLLVRVHEPRVTDVQQRTRCGSMKADPADIGPEPTPEGASVSSDRRAQRSMLNREVDSGSEALARRLCQNGTGERMADHSHSRV